MNAEQTPSSMDKERAMPAAASRASGGSTGRVTERPRSGRVSSGLALILSAIAVLATGYLWYTLVYQRQDLLRADVTGTLARLERETQELRKGLTESGDRLALTVETQETMKSALEKMQADLGHNRAEWIVSEAEQLLLIANRRLQLARDVSSALAALRAADRQIDLLASPALLPVRRELAREITLLESVERTDVAGISLKLGTLADAVDRLPLARELQVAVAQAPQAESAGGPASPAREMWQDLLSLVRIRHHEAAQKPLLPPEQQYFVRENLRLMFLGAQHALLQSHIATYQQNLETAQRWVQEYFDPESQTVAVVKADLEKLRATSVMTEMPDISASLETLRKVSRRRD
jgi:uncharacterized protein HemX